MTNKEVARLLSLSTTAVSLALNDKPGVSEETRQQVKNLKYRRAKIKRATDKKSIVMVVYKKHGEIINDKPFFSELIQTIQQTALHGHYSLALSHYTPGSDPKVYLQELLTLNPDGFIVLATEMLDDDLSMFLVLNTPIILLDASFLNAPFDSVEINNEQAIFLAVSHAVSKGHTDIGYLQSKTKIQNFEHRHSGFTEATQYFGISDSIGPIYQLSCSTEAAYKDMLSIIQRGMVTLPTVFICDLDYIALGAMRALQESGYRIPEDISIIGFDDVPGCSVFAPTLTTIKVNNVEMGNMATRQLMARINHGRAGVYSVSKLSTTLMERESVAETNKTKKKNR